MYDTQKSEMYQIIYQIKAYGKTKTTVKTL